MMTQLVYVFGPKAFFIFLKLTTYHICNVSGVPVFNGVPALNWRGYETAGIKARALFVSETERGTFYRSLNVFRNIYTAVGGGGVGRRLEM
jgi:hypothetical protein